MVLRPGRISFVRCALAIAILIPLIRSIEVSKKIDDWQKDAHDLAMLQMYQYDFAPPDKLNLTEEFKLWWNDNGTTNGTKLEYTARIGHVALYQRMYKRWSHNLRTGKDGYFREFPEPFLRQLDEDVEEKCNLGIIQCIEYVHNLIKKSIWFDPAFFTEDFVDEFNNSSEGSVGILDKNTFRYLGKPDEHYERDTTVAYYFCWMTMLEIPLLAQLPFCYDHDRWFLKQSTFQENDKKPTDVFGTLRMVLRNQGEYMASVDACQKCSELDGDSRDGKCPLALMRGNITILPNKNVSVTFVEVTEDTDFVMEDFGGVTIPDIQFSGASTSIEIRCESPNEIQNQAVSAADFGGKVSVDCSECKNGTIPLEITGLFMAEESEDLIVEFGGMQMTLEKADPLFFVDGVDEEPFRCARYSFCPDPCCGRETLNSYLFGCPEAEWNPCATMLDPTCELKPVLNQNFVRMVQNRWNVTCECAELGFSYSIESDVCLDWDECVDPHFSHGCTESHSVCVNTVGSFKCLCEIGYKMNVDGKCVEMDILKNVASWYKPHAGSSQVMGNTFLLFFSFVLKLFALNLILSGNIFSEEFLLLLS